MKCNLERETNGAITWDDISWKKAHRIVRNLQTRIFKATRQGNYKKVRQLQKLLLRSQSNIITSVRKATQINQGKKTPRIDKQLALTKRERGKLVEALTSWGSIWCGEHISSEGYLNVQLHHIIPIREGGKDKYDNLIYLHSECHRQVTTKGETKPATLRRLGVFINPKGKVNKYPNSSHVK